MRSALRKNDKTARAKVGRHYVSVYLSMYEEKVWNVGVSVCKSKRASNDWYQARNNKRSRRVEGFTIAPTPTGAIFKAVGLLKKLMARVPKGDWVLIDPADLRRHALPLYMRRFGFRLITLDERPVWVLKVQ
jgi:hypothetical protein